MKNLDTGNNFNIVIYGPGKIMETDKIIKSQNIFIINLIFLVMSNSFL